MQPSFSSRDRAGEDEPMLGVALSSPGAVDMRDGEPLFDFSELLEKAEARKSRRNLRFWIFLGVCALSLLALPAFFFLEASSGGVQPSHQHSHDQKLQHGQASHDDKTPHEHDGQDMFSITALTTTPDPTTSTTVTSAQASVLSSPSTTIADDQDEHVSPSDQLDLKTGFLVSSEPKVREYVFNITRGIGAPDGVSKSMIFINGLSPGPLIEANTGDRIRVTVQNQMLGDSTSIHWHGIDQRNSVWMDGVHGVTQCAIPPGESFTYEFDIPDQRGTFWYHAHVRVQYTDGLYGPFIIHDPEEMIPAVDDDKILMIGDLFHEDGDQILNEYLGPKPSWSPKMPGMDPPPDNFIMNGQSRMNCSVIHQNKPRSDFLHYMTEHMEHDDEDDSDPAPNTDIGTSRTVPIDCTGGSRYATRVKSGQSVRLRLISHSTATPFWFNVDHHTLSIVEIDGVEVEPVATTRVFMYPGQRYSVLLTTNQTSGNYRMRATAATKCFHMPHHHHQTMPFAFASVNYEVIGILAYDETDIDAEPLGSRWNLQSTANPQVGQEPWKGTCRDLPFGLPRPMRAMKAFAVSEKNHHYFTYMKIRAHTEINGTIHQLPTDDALLWNFHGDTNATSNESRGLALGPADQHFLVSEDANSAARIVINSDNMMAHPWHLHGQNFQIVGWGKGLYGKGKTHWNLDNPMRRDTLTIPGHSHVIIQIRADNPGLWLLHCHISWHAEGGMFVMVGNQLDKLKKMLTTLDSAETVPMVRRRFCPKRPTNQVQGLM